MVRRAFDIYYSRLLTVNMELNLRNKELVSSEAFKRVVVSRDAMAALIDGVTVLGPRHILKLTDLTRQDKGDILEIANRSVQVFSKAEEAQRLAQRDLLLRLGVLMGVLFTLMSVAIVLAVRISRQAAFQARGAARIASKVRRIIDASLDGMIVADASGIITHLNEATLRLFGHGQSDLLGASISDYLFHQTPDDRDTDVGQLTRYQGPNRLVASQRDRLTVVHGSGREIPLEVSIVSDQDGDGRPIFIFFLRDMTIELEAETRLRRARDLARFEAAEKSRFLAMMSHEMRTPLHGVLASLDLINTRNLSDGDRRFLNTAQACSVSALEQVDEVLEVTRSGATEVTVSVFDPRKLVADLLDDLRPLATERGNRLLLTPPETEICPAVSGWRRGFLLVLRNLVSNAVKFTRGGEIVVTLGCLAQPDGRLALDVEVRDTGLGIDPGDHDRVFREFETLVHPGQGGLGGVGLGLAITRSAVERMGGKIMLESALDRGSCFSFRLLLDPAPADGPVKATGLPDPEAKAAAPPPEPCRVLVVDDNPVNLALLAEMLRRIGHRPEIALDGPTAVAMAHGEAFDLILMDIGMPGMDGLAATRAIRAGGASAYCPIVGVTALVLEERRPSILAAGMQDVLSKPLRLAQLRSYLAEFFSDHMPDLDAKEDEGYDEARSLMGDVRMAQLVEQVIQDTKVALTALRTPLGAKSPQDLLHRAAGSAAVIGALALAEALLKGERNAMAGLGHAVCQSTAEIAAEIAAELARTERHVQRRWPDSPRAGFELAE
jgi:PAS domain S-box-containing protein